MRRLYPLFLLVSLLLLPASAQAAVTQMSTVTVPFGSGQASVASSFLSPSGDRAYFGAAVNPGSAFSLATDPLALPVSIAPGDSGEANFQVGFRSPDGQYGYFSANDVPPTTARVVKIDLATTTRLAGANLGFSQTEIRSGSISPDGQYGYFGTWNQGGVPNDSSLVKFNLQTMSPVSELQVPSAYGYVASVLVAPGGNTAWIVGYNGKVGKVDLASMTLLETADLSSNQIDTAVLSPGGSFSYIPTGSSPAKIIRFNNETMSETDLVTLSAGQNDVNAAGISPDGQYGYFATNTDPGQFITVRLSDMTVTDTFTMASDDKNPGTMSISPDGQFAYVGTTSVDGGLHSNITKLRLAQKYNLTVSKTGSGTVSGSGVDCGSSCSISRLDYQDTTINLTATPAAGQVFKGWTGDCSGTGACSVSLTADRSVGALFEAALNPEPNPNPNPDPNPNPNPSPQPEASLKVSELKVKLGKKTAYLSSVAQVNLAGKISQVATSQKGKKVKTWCKTSKAANASGKYTLKCSLGKKGRKALKKGSLKLTVRTSFTPNSGTAFSDNKKLTIKKKR